MEGDINALYSMPLLPQMVLEHRILQSKGIRKFPLEVFLIPFDLVRFALVRIRNILYDILYPAWQEITDIPHTFMEVYSSLFLPRRHLKFWHSALRRCGSYWVIIKNVN